MGTVLKTRSKISLGDSKGRPLCWALPRFLVEHETVLFSSTGFMREVSLQTVTVVCVAEH